MTVILGQKTTYNNKPLPSLCPILRGYECKNVEPCRSCNWFFIATEHCSFDFDGKVQAKQDRIEKDTFEKKKLNKDGTKVLTSFRLSTFLIAELDALVNEKEYYLSRADAIRDAIQQLLLIEKNNWKIIE